VVFCLGGTELDHAGYEPWTTNNRMELVAVIEGLALVASPGPHVRVHLDSTYVRNAFVKGWLERWGRNGWRRADGGEVLNRDLWERLVAEVARHERVEWCNVAGHSGVRLNERAHQLVAAARERANADPQTAARA
jgi:ribonuclease HI